MSVLSYRQQSLACAYFFLCPGLAYGMLTSRMPAYKIQIQADEAQIGLLLLSLGVASLISLFSSNYIIQKFSSKKTLFFGSALLVLSILLCGLADTVFFFGIACALAGFGMGFLDVAMNTQGILLEKKFKKSSMNFLHASYSLGGVIGALSGAIFASFSLSPLVNAILLFGLYVLFYIKAYGRLLPDEETNATVQEKSSPTRIPFFIIFCGIMSLVAYASEGSVAEWGSLYLNSVKNAPESVSALVFAFFSATTVVCRVFGDRVREYVGDFKVCCYGALLALFGIIIVLYSANLFLCLLGYALMGIGLSPIVPVIFSIAGNYPGISPSKACSVVSLLSYSGLLFFPPLLGFLAHEFGLQLALHVVLINCIFLFAGAFSLRIKK